MKQCERGHFFDEQRYTDCPYCRNVEAPGKTVAAWGPPAVGKTVPVVPPESGEKGKTVGLIKKAIGIDPAVGFLVCIAGPHKGEDFRLRAGRNFVGRSSAMNVSLPDDDAVSRENHALVSYDQKGNTFLVAPGQGRGITYRNDVQVENAEPLSAYDVIEVGASRLLFLPLCGAQFRWE